uniref:Uncharacterized protein n=1 Tax=Opuntia streptacantha TaxID=393608 RepID=A0A7C9CDF0_OPUST
MDRIVFAVTRGGSFSGSAVDTKMSTPGRSDFPVGLLGPGVSNLSLKTLRSETRLTGLSLGSWSRTQENANQISQTTDIPHSHGASVLGCFILHARNNPRTASRINARSL